MQFRPEKATEARFLVEALLLSFTSGLAIQLYLGYRDSPRGTSRSGNNLGSPCICVLLVRLLP